LERLEALKDTSELMVVLQEEQRIEALDEKYMVGI